MGKDPAALIYIDAWLASTSGMPADARAWYFDMIIHQFDKGDLPNDLDELSGICRVRLSESTRFEHVFEHLLKQKFELNANGRLENARASEIIRGREKFKEKRSNAGKMSYCVRRIYDKYSKDQAFISFYKENVDLDFDIKNEQVFEQVFKQTFELYINRDGDKDEDRNIDNGGTGEKDFKQSPTASSPSTEFIPPLNPPKPEKAKRQSSVGTIAQNPPELLMVQCYWAEWTVYSKNPRPNWTKDMAFKLAEDWYDSMKTKGWKVGKAPGTPMRDWQAASRTGIKNAEEWGKVKAVIETTSTDGSHKEFSKKVVPL